MKTQRKTFGSYVTIDGRFRITRQGREWEVREQSRRSSIRVRTLREGKRIADRRWLNHNLLQGDVGRLIQQHYPHDPLVQGILASALDGNLRALDSLLEALYQNSPFRYEVYLFRMETASMGILPMAAHW